MPVHQHHHVIEIRGLDVVFVEVARMFRFGVHKLDAIERKVNEAMSKIADFAARQNAHNDSIDRAIAGLQADNKAMTDLIQQLQTSPGPISPEDQAALDALEARTAKQDEALTALDALQPPSPADAVPAPSDVPPGA